MNKWAHKHYACTHLTAIQIACTYTVYVHVLHHAVKIVQQPLHVEMSGMWYKGVSWQQKTKHATFYLCILMYKDPQHCPGPKLTCVVSLNSCWQSITSWQRWYPAGREPTQRKHGKWHLGYTDSQHLLDSLSPSQSHTSSFVLRSDVLLWTTCN